MSRWRRLLATAITLLLAAGVAAYALAAQSPSKPPSIVLDEGGPLFTLQGMRPGAAPEERCIALTARGGTATRLELSGTVDGPLAQRLLMQVAVGSAPAPAATRSCDGFTAERELWSGTLADFPADDGPLLSAGPLPGGQRHVFRFRVRLPADAVVSASDTATQDLRWRAELDPPTTSSTPVPAPPPTESPPVGGQGLAQQVGCAEPARAGSGASAGADVGADATTRRCRGRLIVRLTPRAARLHARIHAPGSARISSLSLRLPTALPASRARIAVSGLRGRGTVLELTGSVRTRLGAPQQLLTLVRLPAGTRTVLMRVKVPRQARGVLLRAGCRRAPVEARLRTDAGTRRLLQRLYVAPASCRAR
ncbi:hypothetical protein VSS74_16750 [Conexibacter stalactiti]|uniref:Uncharacterized protein n=1 Tax=Conexibacter stalactiti TaxID=1940611 RepID=A0ABU4HRR8_9ACTN|nr:hypothetical protein [Conexibacter stalactiti]MDW5596001.1 hypothetical protein [Conexibacter stalactiti]MEC5036643.1 hypothetical protein [Conexibacter stalactiti]